MLKCYASWPVIVALLLAPVFAGQPAASIDIEEAYAVHEPVIATVLGDADVYLWDDPDGFQMIELEQGRVLHIWAPPGAYKLRCLLLKIDWEAHTFTKSVVRAEFVVGEGPEPEPDPNPQPAVFGIIIEERDDRDDLGPQRAMVMESAKIRALFPVGRFQVRDDDVVDEGGKEPPADVKPYIDRARKLGLPALFLVDVQGKILFEGPVPEDVPATVALIQERMK